MLLLHGQHVKSSVKDLKDNEVALSTEAPDSSFLFVCLELQFCFFQKGQKICGHSLPCLAGQVSPLTFFPLAK